MRVFTIHPEAKRSLALRRKPSVSLKAWALSVREALARHGALAESMPAAVQALDVGGLCIVGLPGEIFCQIGCELKRRLPDHRTWTLGYSNQQTYIVSRDTHSESGSLLDPNFIYCLTPEPCSLGFAPEAVDHIIDAVIGLTW